MDNVATAVRRNACQEIVARFIGERMRFSNESGDVAIVEAHLVSTASDVKPGRITLKGPVGFGELREGQQYVFYGKFSKYTNKRTGQTEDQFHFDTFVREEPADRDSIVSYLVQHGERCGIGAARSFALWQAFGSDAVRISREEPARVVEALAAAKLKTSIEQAKEFASKLGGDVATERVKLDLTSLLRGRGFPKGISTLLIQDLGNKAAQLVRRCPYILMKYKNCGFKKTDALYLDLGLPASALKRQALSAWYAVARDTEGHTWYPHAYPTAFLRANISGANVDIEKALKLATRGKALAEIRASSEGVSWNGNDRWFAEHKKAEHEQQIAEAIVASKNEKLLWPKPDLIQKVSEHQREQISKSLSSSICILGGSPGTGKTWSVASLVEALIRIVGADNIAIGAPTGKAAVRVTENLIQRGIRLKAYTWHSWLNRIVMHFDGRFPQKVLIGDESSMLDTDLMSAILRARHKGTHVLLVGDVNQLPPVGHGAPLRDMIAAGVAYGELREIQRNSGGIVEACAAIRDNLPWSAGDNLIMRSQGSPEGTIAALLETLEQARESGIDPIWDCQPVVAVNESSPLSRVELNKILQQKLNRSPGVDGMKFRVGDKLVNTKNGYFDCLEHEQSDEVQTNDRNAVYVANGELAKVVEIKGKQVIAELQSPNRTIIFGVGASASEEGEESGCTFDLGYALTVHKAQGSDWKWAIPILDEYPGARRICDRSWLYTAISRAKDRCILIGKKSTADRMVRVANIQNRKTFLREQILRLSAIEDLAGV